MSPIIKILFGKKSFEIMYRWEVEGTFTGWTTYKKFKTKKRLQVELDKLNLKSSSFIEYRVA